MIIKNFKGISEKEIDFSKRTSISGKNATGKSTIATAYFWCLFDKDYELNSNPPIQPLDMVESLPSVTLVFDDKIHLTKIQKKKVTETDGVTKVSLSNVYECNSVPITERDFKAKLEEYGFPEVDTFLACSHAEVFTSKKQADMRKVLFALAKDMTDKDIASSLGNVNELMEMLENYSIDEITAMEKAAVKKCDEQLKSIPDQIIGLESAKVDIDVAELELEKNAIQEKILEKESFVKKAEETVAEKNELSSRLLELEFNKNSIVARLHEGTMSEKTAMEEKLSHIHNDILSAERKCNNLVIDINKIKDSISNEQSAIDEETKKYKSIKASVFDDSSLVCPCCGQSYPEKKKERIKAEFESKKAQDLEDCTKRGKAAQTNRDLFKEELEAKLIENEEAEDTLKKLNEEYEELKKRIDSFQPLSVDPNSSDEYKAVIKEIEDTNKKIESIKSNNSEILEVRNEIKALNQSLVEIEKQISQINNNVSIDEKISKLQETRINYEQEKANCEKILYQVDLLSKAKNNILSEEINSHFELVNFKLFDYAKNGSYKEVVIPMVGDKELGKSMNTALELRAKLDIINGLQKAYEVSLPCFVDNSECLDNDSINEIHMDNQLIFLSVSNNELEVKGE